MSNPNKRRRGSQGNEPAPINSISKPPYPALTYPDLSLLAAHIKGRQSSAPNDEGKSPSTTRKKALPSGSGYAPPTFASESEDGSPVEKPDPRFTEEKRRKINELLKMDKNHASHYQILGLDDFCDDFNKIAWAWKKRCIDFHSDKNGFPERKECEDIVNNAYKVLSNDRERASYDRSLRKRKGKGKQAAEDPFEPGEEFAPNAWGRETGDHADLRKHEYFDDEPSVPPQRRTEEPSASIRELQEMAADHVETLICDTDGRKREDARRQIEAINKRIKHEKKKSHAPETYTIKTGDLLPISKDTQAVESYIRRGMARTAGELGTGIIRNFRALCRRPENQWPADWVDFVKESISNIHKRHGREWGGREFVAATRQRPWRQDGRVVGPASSRRQPEHHTGKIDDDVYMVDDEGDVCMVDDEDVDIVDDEEDVYTIDEIPLSAIKNLDGTGIGSTSAENRLVKPGRTLDGEEILGYRQWFGSRPDRTPYGVTFIIRVKGENPIEPRPGKVVGDTARDAYFAQHRSRLNEVQQARVRGDTRIPIKVLGYASYRTFDSTRIPDGTALCQLDDGTELLITRAGLRDWVNEDVADHLISKYLESLEQKRLPSPIRRGGRLLGRRDDYHYRQRAMQRDDSDYDTEDSEYDDFPGRFFLDYKSERDQTPWRRGTRHSTLRSRTAASRGDVWDEVRPRLRERAAETRPGTGRETYRWT